MSTEQSQQSDPQEEPTANRAHLSDEAQSHAQLRDALSFHQHPHLPYRLEAHLCEKGLFTVLEEAGILPPVENPNPYDLELDTAAHVRWALAHREKTEHFMRSVEKREEVLRGIFVGLTLAAFSEPQQDQSSSEE